MTSSSIYTTNQCSPLKCLPSNFLVMIFAILKLQSFSPVRSSDMAKVTVSS